MRTRGGSGDFGNLLIVTLEEGRWNTSLEHGLRRLRPAGVLMSTPRLPSAPATADLLGRIARVLEATPFLCLTEEGGETDPLHGIFPRLPSPRAAAQEGEPAVEQLGRLIGAGLELLGFNTNLAPCLDLSASAPDTHAGGQTFGLDARVVTRCAEAFLRGLL